MYYKQITINSEWNSTKIHEYNFTLAFITDVPITKCWCGNTLLTSLPYDIRLDCNMMIIPFITVFYVKDFYVMFVINALFIPAQVQLKMMTLICLDLNNSKHSITLQMCIVEYQYYFVLHENVYCSCLYLFYWDILSYCCSFLLQTDYSYYNQSLK